VAFHLKEAELNTAARAVDVQPRPTIVSAAVARQRPWVQAFLARSPRLLARIAWLLGVLALIDAVWPHHWRLLSVFGPLVPGPARAAVDATIAVSGLLLVRIATGLRKGKRAEWRLAVFASAAITVADLLRDERRPEEAAVALVLLAGLLVARSRFKAKPDPRSEWFAVRVAAQFLAIATTYGMVLLYLPGHVAGKVSFWSRLREVVTSLVGLGGWIRISDERFGDIFHTTLLGFGMLTLVCGVVLLVRTPEPLAVLSPEDEQRLRELLRRHGARDSLGYFALRRDKSVVWSASGKAAITYRVVSGVALVSGDPIGDPEAWPGAIDAFRRLVEGSGWTPAVMGCSELGAVVFRREYGLTVLALGDEAILSVPEFSLDGRAMRCVRQACTRLQRAGYAAEVRRSSSLDAAELAELRAAADAWRGEAVERGYSMALSRVGDPADADCVVVTARQHGTLRGLLHFVPWSDRGISLDLMRRDRTSDNGVNEFMIAAIMQACPSLGIERVSLNFAVFRDALERGHQIGAGPAVRLWRRVLLTASRWWQIESLYRFNAKFQPRWLPRFICYPSTRDIPRVAIAALEAEAFIVRPRILKRILGRA
jgi:lysyl-tRNA synthetase class 2